MRAASMLLTATAAVACGLLTATPAAADPADSGTPYYDTADPLPISIGTFDQVWNAFVPPNTAVPQSPIASLGPLIDQLFPIIR